MTGFPKAVRGIVEKRADGCCERCGKFRVSFQLHHRRPRGIGGSRRQDTNTASNALALCPSCHFVVEADRESAREFGWLVRQGHNPADVPVYRQGRWVLLDDHGCVIPAKETA